MLCRASRPLLSTVGHLPLGITTRPLHSSSSLLARVLASDPIDPIAPSILEEAGHTVDVPSDGKPIPADTLRGMIKDYDALIVRSGTTVTSEIVDAADNLKFIGRAGTGVNNIDLDAATRRGMVVMNTPGGNTSSAAEMTISLLLSLSRNIAQACSALKEGVWDRKSFTGVELAGKTIGIIGLGRIGREVATACQGFDMNTIGYDPLLSEEAAEKQGITLYPLEEIWSKCDFITIHSPLSALTRNLVDREVLASCKRGVRIINCARGGIVNEQDLLEALESGQVAGAGLDVFTQEPPVDGAALALANHPRVVSTPHLGASTSDAQFRVARDIALYIRDALAGSKFTGVVNTSGLELQSKPTLRPWLDLANRLGALQAQQLSPEFGVDNIQVRIRGDLISDSSVAKMIRTSVLAGLVNELTLTKDANMVNTPMLVKAMGLNVSDLIINEPDPDHNNKITVEITDLAGSTRSYAATLMSGRPRLVAFNEARIDVAPVGPMLTVLHADRPGTLQRITATLGHYEIPVAEVALAREAGSTKALSVFNLDQALPAHVSDVISDLVGVQDVAVAELPGLSPSSEPEADMPTVRPNNPNFGSGPTTKYPGWSLADLSRAALGRSHRSALGKAKLKDAIERTKALLDIPEGYHVGIVPASDTGAFEMAMWSMLGPQPVDVLHWESFGKGWYGDAKDHLKLTDIHEYTADYGHLPELPRNPDHDLLFTWNGTTSGVRVPDADWIAQGEGKGLAFCDATSAVFAQHVDFSKLDVVTYSWQKVLGGEGAHGMLILSPKAVERLESYTPSWPLPKIFRMVKKGKLDSALFEGSTINTPSMLCVEDYLCALSWAEGLGGLNSLVDRADANLAVVEEFVTNHEWIDFLPVEADTRSNTSVCLSVDLPKDKIKAMVSLLEREQVAFDIGSYRDAPPGLRIWCGAAVERRDLQDLMPWLAWAYHKVSSE